MSTILIGLPYAKSESNLRTEHLLDLVLEAQYKLGMNDNCLSTGVFKANYLATSSMPSAIASAILTLNGLHAPIQDARDVFDFYDEYLIMQDLKDGKKIAGFGNAFDKDGIDPTWTSVKGYLIDEFFEEYKRLMDLQSMVNYCRKKLKPDCKDIYVNPAMYTAILCSLYNFLRGSELSLFIQARLPCWVMKGIEIDNSR